jgi:signal transduction histidine kinase/DNA-binding response OmpR family regulator
MFVGAPVRGKSDEIIAVLTFRVDPGRDYGAILRRGRIGKSGESYVLDNSGLMISPSRFNDQLRSVGIIGKDESAILNIEVRDPGVNLIETGGGRSSGEFPYTLMAESVLKGEAASNVSGYRDYRGVPVVGAWLWDEELGFGITTEVDTEEAFETIRTGRYVTIALSALSAVLILIMTVVSAASTHRLHEAAILRSESLAAEEMARAKGAFLARMSHEIRTPMNGVLGMLELLTDSELNSEQLEAATIATDSARSLLQILNDILDFSKIEAGQLELETIPFDPAKLVSETANVMSIPSAARGNEIGVEIGSEVPDRVMGDPGRIRQIVTNLLSNAIKFTQDGDVVVSVDAADHQSEGVNLTISVEDTGVGIPTDRQDAIFEEFAQADTSVTRRYGGTGLGLSICKSLVERMGGSLGIQSDEGVGSKFWFTLRLQVPTDAPPRSLSTQTAALSGRKILIVDDNPIARRISRIPLEEAGVEVREEETAAKGLAALLVAVDNKTPFEAVIVDGHMPVHDGFWFSEQVRDRPSLGDTRLLLLTSGSASGDAARARELGIKAYLHKPITRADLLVAVRALLDLRSPSEGMERRMVTRGTLEAARRKLRILLAEDNKVNQKIAKTMLEKRGHKVDVVENGIEAVARVQEISYDLVLMDLEMPEMGGVEATRRIRKIESLKDLKVVALTAHALEEERERCEEAGMNDFLTKPFSSEDLARIVEGTES